MTQSLLPFGIMWYIGGEAVMISEDELKEALIELGKNNDKESVAFNFFTCGVWNAIDYICHKFGIPYEEIAFEVRRLNGDHEHCAEAGCCGDSDSIPRGDNVDDVGAELDCYECGGYGDDYY